MKTVRSKQDDWRAQLQRKQFSVAAWDWKENPRPYIRSLFKPFSIRPSLRGLGQDDDPEPLLATIARQHKLFLYDLVSIRGSDVYGFIVARQHLNRKEIQQVEADFWGEDFNFVYR